ncbi:MAG TPA: hypothetical protein VMU22_11390 [Rhizomicrobium sp.]|nr:hypothetical protein [Rhizomicrobium sp.]
MNLEALRKLRETDAKRRFSFPHELIDDPSLSVSQKREILAEWASDACAIESFPILRLLPGTTFPVTLSAILDALAQLDGESPAESRPKEKAERKKSAAKRHKAAVPHALGRRWHYGSAGGNQLAY